MPSEHEIFEPNALAVVRLTGSVTADVIVQCAEQLYADPQWNPGFSSIWDVRKIGELILLPEDVTHLLHLSREIIARAGTGRRAVVVARDLEHDIATLFSVREKPLGRETRVFWNLPEACAWLGVELNLPAREYLRAA